MIWQEKKFIDRLSLRLQWFSVNLLGERMFVVALSILT
jgi:hypothetical protein